MSQSPDPQGTEGSDRTILRALAPQSGDWVRIFRISKYSVRSADKVRTLRRDLKDRRKPWYRVLTIELGRPPVVGTESLRAHNQR